jgi:hypothetical protein
MFSQRINLKLQNVCRYSLAKSDRRNRGDNWGVRFSFPAANRAKHIRLLQPLSTSTFQSGNIVTFVRLGRRGSQRFVQLSNNKPVVKLRNMSFFIVNKSLAICVYANPMVDEPTDQDARIETDADPDQLRPARGVIVWVLISTVFWILVAVAVRCGPALRPADRLSVQIILTEKVADTNGDQRTIIRNATRHSHLLRNSTEK